MIDVRKSIEKTGLVLAKEIDGLEQIFNRFENLVFFKDSIQLI
jgi:hypothetical protein